MLAAQLCPIFCNPMDCSPPGSSVRGIFRQEYCSGLPFPTPGDLPNPGIEPMSLASSVLAGGFFTTDMLQKKSSHFLWEARESFQEGVLSDLCLKG